MGQRTIEVSANSFSGVSGKTYIVYPSLTAARYAVLETLQLEMQYKTSLSGFVSELQQAYEALNNGKQADAAVILNNAINGAARVESGEPYPILLICALFICAEDEEQGKWSEAEARAKIEDWADIDIAFFLGCASNLFLRFIPALNTDSLSSSEASDAEGDPKQ
ncbi:MAG: hypothetical protein KDC70_00285 [Saprospiraceae bacterium]|nr:hypothetical protein [Saprospiraceae bacterium]